MSIDRKTGLFGWTASDVRDFQERIAKLWSRPRNPCPTCDVDNHAHAAQPVGPYLICRCLRCPTLVIEGAD